MPTFRVQATAPGNSQAKGCGSVFRHLHDVFDHEQAPNERWPAWLRKVPVDCPTIADGKGSYHVKDDTAYVTHHGRVVASFPSDQ